MSAPFARRPRNGGSVPDVPNSRRALDLLEPEDRFMLEFAAELAAQFDSDTLDIGIVVIVQTACLTAVVSWPTIEPRLKMSITPDGSGGVEVNASSEGVYNFAEGDIDHIAGDVRRHICLEISELQG